MKLLRLISLVLLVCVTTVTQGRSLIFCQAEQNVCHKTTDITTDSCCPTQQKQTPPDCCLLLAVDHFLLAANTVTPTFEVAEICPHLHFWRETSHFTWKDSPQTHGSQSPTITPTPQNRRARLAVYLI